MAKDEISEDPYELAFQVDRLMRRMNAGIEARAPDFDTERVGPIGGMTLLSIAEVQPVPMQTIAQMMGRDKGQLSRSISMMERRGLVSREPNEADQRSTLLRLTDKGEDLVGSIKAALDEVLGELLEPLETGERTELLRILKKL